MQVTREIPAAGIQRAKQEAELHVADREIISPKSQEGGGTKPK
jgi:hypothetical protein